MKKLIILIGIIASSFECFGFTYFQSVYTQRQDQQSYTYVISTPSGYTPLYLSYTIEGGIWSGPGTSLSYAWGTITIRDVNNNILKTDGLPTNSQGGFVANTYYSPVCNRPSPIYSATLVLYGEHYSTSGSTVITQGGYMWASISCSSWISVI